MTMNEKLEIDRMTNEGGPDVPAAPATRFERLRAYVRAHRRMTILGATALGLFLGGIVMTTVRSRA